MKAIQRILLALLSILSPWIIGMATSQAALLSDIRVGDYDTHTRIVFELSDTTVFERIISRQPGQLTIIFPNANPQLIRKIPIERSKRVQEIKLMRRQDSLSAVVSFSFDHFRYELKEYQKPFRLVVDVYHLASGQASGLLPQNASETSDALNTKQPQDQPSGAPEQATQLTSLLSETSASLRPSEKTADELPANKPNSEMPPLPRLSQPDTHTSEDSQPIALPSLTDGSNTSDTADSKAKGLQYFLVVGMVVMTIVILLLLLLMLIFKQPKTDDFAVETATKNLRQQDKHIATLNAQIYEQLKRYDEA